MSLNNTQAGAVPETAVPRYPAGGVGKFLSDSVSIFEINLLSGETLIPPSYSCRPGSHSPGSSSPGPLLPDDLDAPSADCSQGTACSWRENSHRSIGMLVGQNAVSQRFTGHTSSSAYHDACIQGRSTSWARCRLSAEMLSYTSRRSTRGCSTAPRGLGLGRRTTSTIRLPDGFDKSLSGQTDVGVRTGGASRAFAAC